MRQREDSSEESRLICKAMEHMLELVETKQDILCQRGSKYTENDYLRIVWSPILERIFSSPLRLISGESIFKYTTKQKQQLYDESNDVKGFKIDIRYVVDKNGKTYDLGAAELGKDGASCKIIQDEGKLTREGKDVVDSLLKTLHESNHRHVLSWIIQIDGMY
ncbi:hypothetical protein BDB00DRAFT_356739 [Zychaea mexicana]|uniref:uncharacterized protein n=1 Tax=Zychaea mexicana TaxID=64656 RepID=UPI0022FE802F|nr:uncharacterized protein BDB00DRAFT_356739 [Zychaea mexicana]KAI9493825.1 hypothetical protein BDB00DRAFT_356739 [Zychaea mexicana]